MSSMVQMLSPISSGSHAASPSLPKPSAVLSSQTVCRSNNWTVFLRICSAPFTPPPKPAHGPDLMTRLLLLIYSTRRSKQHSPEALQPHSNQFQPTDLYHHRHGYTLPKFTSCHLPVLVHNQVSLSFRLQLISCTCFSRLHSYRFLRKQIDLPITFWYVCSATPSAPLLTMDSSLAPNFNRFVNPCQQLWFQ